MDSKELFGEISQQEPVCESVLQQEPVREPEPIPVSEQEMTSEQIQQTVEETAKKGNNGAAVAVLTLLFILVIGLCVYIAVSVSKMLPKDGEKKDTEYESQTEDPWEEILGDDYVGGEQDAADDDGLEENGSGADFDSGTHDYPNYSKDDFSGPYYQDVADCIDETVSYGVERKFSDCVEKENNVYIYTSYIQLSGDIPGVDEINRQLEENATYFVKSYEENKDEILETLEGTGTGIQAEFKSYVTYNTEHTISIVVREDISMGYMYRDVALRCYNINLDTGTILDNTSILDLQEGFGQEFRDRSNRQNGVSEGGIEPYTNAQIEAMLSDETTLILFYTPLGMELGYNYSGQTYTGWITITMQDYEKYLSRM